MHRLFARQSGRRQKALSSVIGALILFGMLFTIAFGYLYTISQDQQIYQAAAKQNALNLQLKSSENLYISTMLNGVQLVFGVNNSGIPATLVSYVITDQTGKVDAYLNPPSRGTILACSPIAAMLPCTVNQGGSAVFSTNVNYTIGYHYSIKVLTQRGTIVTGTYPAQFLTSQSVNSVVASGLGSLAMVFSSFTFYNYTSTYQLNMRSAESAAITPYGKNIAFSVQITNNDPSAGTIFIDSHADLWTFVSCGSGCGSTPLIPFYIVNVNSNGTITSQAQGSYVPISVPYGVTQTLFFASKNDLGQGSFAQESITDSNSPPYVEFDVFLIISGSVVTPKNSTLYSQNLPYAATFSSDNIVSYYSETPTQCANGTSTTFSLTVTNSAYSPGGLSQVSIQAGAFSSLSAGSASVPGWVAQPISNGVITWKTSTNYIPHGQSITFTWTGTSPIVSAGTEVVFPTTAYFNGGTVTAQPINTGCYVS